MGLHNSGKHEQVIAAIEAALVNGQSQPWMYEVLALSMEIAGRPKSEVERALLSGVDFAGADFESMMFSAAYLTRFGANAAALRMYRQASRLAPTRPEPYILALKLARGGQDADAVQWAATGVLNYDWGYGHQERHKQAVDAFEELIQNTHRLPASEREFQRQALSAALSEARKRDLYLRLSWNGEGDLDLIVEEPAGTVCSVETPYSPGGGVLVHDGHGPQQTNCYEEYICAVGSPGTYHVKIRHVWGSIVGKRAQLTIARYLGTPQEVTQVVPVSIGLRDTVVRISLPHGRRTELTPMAVQLSRPEVPQKRRGNLLQMTAASLDADARRSAQRFAASRNLGFTPPAGQNVGYTPVITTLSEGIAMSAQAVVSGDRRYVRLTVVPNFSTITDVFTFSFVNFGGGGGAGGGLPGGGLPGGGLPGGGGVGGVRN